MSEEYPVEKIIGKRTIKGKVEYKVKWDGYPMDQCTWEPLRNLENVREMVEEYENKLLGEQKAKEFLSNKRISPDHEEKEQKKEILKRQC